MRSSELNRRHNAHNPYQSIKEHKRVLCVCSAGLLRSPTAAVVLSQDPFNYNTRAAGVDGCYALIPVDAVLLEWADEVVCMTRQQSEMLAEIMSSAGVVKPVKVLDIPDNFGYRDPELMSLIADKYQNG